MIAFVWLDAAAGSGYRPAQAALLPTVARSPGEMTASTTLISNVKTSGQLIGALLGGALVALLSVWIPVALAAILYATAGLLTLAERRPKALRAPLLGLQGLRAGFQTLTDSREARVIVGYSCMRSLVRGLWFSLAVVVCLQVLRLGTSGFGILMAAAAAGALAAILLTAQLVGRPRMSRWMAIGLLLCGLPILLTGITGSAIPAIILMVIWGLGMALSDVGAQTLLNRIIPGPLIGPLTGVMETGKLLAEGIGSMGAPALLALTGTRSAVVIAGAALPLVVIAGYRSLSELDRRAVSRVDLLELLRGVPFFAPLRLDALEGVAARLQPVTRPAGEVIMRQGDLDAHEWFVVDVGELVVEIESFVVAELHRGDQFGERALLRGAPRAATVRAVTDVELYRLERDDFLAAVGGVGGIEFSDPERTSEPGPLGAGQTRGEPSVEPGQALAGAPLLRSVDDAGLGVLMEHSRVRTVQLGAAIVSDGDTDDTYHVLLSGRAEVISGGSVLGELLPGDAFGEISVLHRVPRTASVVASEVSRVLTVEGDAVRAVVRDHGGDAIAALAG